MPPKRSFDHHLLHAKYLMIQTKKNGPIVMIKAELPSHLEKHLSFCRVFLN